MLCCAAPTAPTAKVHVTRGARGLRSFVPLSLRLAPVTLSTSCEPRTSDRAAPLDRFALIVDRRRARVLARRRTVGLPRDAARRPCGRAEERPRLGQPRSFLRAPLRADRCAPGAHRRREAELGPLTAAGVVPTVQISAFANLSSLLFNAYGACDRQVNWCGVYCMPKVRGRSPFTS